MARYIQDYLYAQLPKKAVGRSMLWNEFEELPEAEERYFMQFAVVDEMYYICIKKDGKYI